MTVELEKEVWNENSVMTLLGVNAQQLKNLWGNKKLPSVMLFQGKRVFLAEDVLEYIRTRKAAQD